jgi:hypothetical protein
LRDFHLVHPQNLDQRYLIQQPYLNGRILLQNLQNPPPVVQMPLFLLRLWLSLMLKS